MYVCSNTSFTCSSCTCMHALCVCIPLQYYVTRIRPQVAPTFSSSRGEMEIASDGHQKRDEEDLKSIQPAAKGSRNSRTDRDKAIVGMRAAKSMYSLSQYYVHCLPFCSAKCEGRLAPQCFTSPYIVIIVVECACTNLEYCMHNVMQLR